MNKVIIFLFGSILIPLVTFSQLEMVDTTNGVTREIYYLDEKGLRQKGYKLQFNDLNQVIGSYYDNLKHGKWTFRPDHHFLIIGYYKSDKKDSVWSCYINNKLFSTINYRTGTQRSYYPNGRLRTQSDSIGGEYLFYEFTKKGKIVKQERSDSVFIHRQEFDKKGNIIEDIIFKNKFPYEIIQTNDQNMVVYFGDVKKGNGKLQTNAKIFPSGEMFLYETIFLSDSKPNGKYEKFNGKGKLLESGNYQNGFMEGDWIRYNSMTFQIDTVITYSLNDSTSIDENNRMGMLVSNYCITLEDLPVFNGESSIELPKFIKSQMKYPKEAVEKRIQGRVFVEFKVDYNGKVEEVKIVEGVNPLLDNEALRLVSLFPYWRPAMQRGEPVPVFFTIPINFVLNNP